MLEILSNGGCDMDVMIRTQSRIQNYQLCLGYLFSLGHTSDTTCCAWHQPTNPHQNCNAHSFFWFCLSTSQQRGQEQKMLYSKQTVVDTPPKNWSSKFCTIERHVQNNAEQRWCHKYLWVIVSFALDFEILLKCLSDTISMSLLWTDCKMI